jgi:phosphoribosylformylglycinamidine synthase
MSTNAPSDAAIVNIKGSKKALAMTVDCNSRYVNADPETGCAIAVSEAARNIVCSGGIPSAVTNCLNFASPERPDVMRSFSDVIDGLTEACEAFETPVVSGNVSFYNETEGKTILPTPVIGMVGLIEDTRKIITQGFKDEGDIIALLGVTKDDLSVSEYAQSVLGLKTGDLIANGRLPELDISLEKQVQQTVLKLADAQLLKSAHDCSDGGLAVAIAECCFSSLGRDAIGARIELESNGLAAEAILFAETPSRVVISFSPERQDKVREIVGECPFSMLGVVTGSEIDITTDGEAAINAPVSELENVWCNSLEQHL